MVTPQELFEAEYISYSRLKSYDQCPQRFKLEYLERLPCPVGRAGQIGTLVHAVIADYLTAVQRASIKARPKLSELEPRVVPKCEELHDEGQISERISESEAREPLRGFIRLMPEVDGRAIEGVEIEQRFRINQYDCKAILDLVMRKLDGQRWIIDFKTGKAKYVQRFQLQFYALPYVAKPSWPDVEIAFAFLREAAFHRYSMRHEDGLHTASKVLKRIHRIERDNHFRGSPSFLCRYCGVRKYCDYR